MNEIFTQILKNFNNIKDFLSINLIDIGNAFERPIKVGDRIQVGEVSFILRYSKNSQRTTSKYLSRKEIYILKNKFSNEPTIR